eukprot:556088-Rhodomonas_salina.1
MLIVPKSSVGVPVVLVWARKAMQIKLPCWSCRVLFQNLSRPTLSPAHRMGARYSVAVHMQCEYRAARSIRYESTGAGIREKR